MKILTLTAFRRLFCCLTALSFSVLLLSQAKVDAADSEIKRPSLLKLQILLRGKGEDYELKIDNENTAYYNDPQRSGSRIDTALSALHRRIKNSQILVIIHNSASRGEEIFDRIANMRSFLKRSILFADMGFCRPEDASEIILWKSESPKGNLFVVEGIQYRRTQDVLRFLRSKKVRFVVPVGFGMKKNDSKPPAKLREELQKAKISILETTQRLRVWDGSQ